MQYLVASQLTNWSSKRQAYITLSTVEAELAAMFECRVAVQSVLPLVRKLLGLSVCDGPEIAVALQTDNTAAVASTTMPGGSWRARHLRIKAGCRRERIAAGWDVEL